MKKLFTITLLLLAGLTLRAADTQIDSLKQKLQLTTNDTLKGPIYTQIAAEYLKYDVIVNRNRKAYYQSEAIHYTMLALHNYSFYEDTTGIKSSFDDLAQVYLSQKKYSQAKWFVLQSINISRIKKDVPNLITGLVKLSAIKMETKDYKLAMRDLNEALRWSVGNKMPEKEALVQQNFAYLYNRMKDYDNGDIALKKANEINDNIKRDAELKSIADATPQDSLQIKKVVITPKSKKSGTATKKKLYATGKKPAKLNNATAKKLASL